MHFVSFSSLSAAAASIQQHLITPEKKARTEHQNHVRFNHNFGGIRSQVLLLNANIGYLCRQFYNYAPLDPNRYRPKNVRNQIIYPPTLADDQFWCTASEGRDAIYDALGMVFWDIITTAEYCSFDLRSCILKKMYLNKKKYKAELCKGKSGKYTDYSSETGITVDEGQSTLHIIEDNAEGSSGGEGTNKSNNSANLTIRDMSLFIRDFAMEREWQEFHTPRNILHALIGEMGELSELFQWKGDFTESSFENDHKKQGALSGWTDDELDHLQQELADVAIYCLRLADVCCIDDLGAVALKFSSALI